LTTKTMSTDQLTVVRTDHWSAHTTNADVVLLADPAPGSVLDSPAVRGWFETLTTVNDAGVNTYHLPLDRRAGATSSIHGREVTLFSSYSYLGLNGHPRIDAAAREAIDRYGTSPGGVRVLTGTLALHREVEAKLATFLGVGGASLYQSGYDANLAALGALFDAQDTLILDHYAHHSLREGARLSGATVRRFGHNRLDDLERQLQELAGTPGRRVVVVDGVYSMEGDLAPLAELVDLKRRYGALLVVDESHAIGAVGASGRGTFEALGVDPNEADVITASLAKGIPSAGGLVAGSLALVTFLQHGSSPYVFSGAVSAANAAAIGAALDVVDDEPQHLADLRANTERLVGLLRELGLAAGEGRSPVVPLELGSHERTLRWARTLLDHDVAVSAVVYPAVPLGRARLRLCATGSHRAEHFERLEAGLRRCLADEDAAADRD
jgi:7-keto-8-aminopelargonate synthetase-like enzyme